MLSRVFLDALYKQKQDVDKAINEAAERVNFPDDGYSIQVHEAEMQSLRHMSLIVDRMINNYLETHHQSKNVHQ